MKKLNFNSLCFPWLTILVHVLFRGCLEFKDLLRDQRTSQECMHGWHWVKILLDFQEISQMTMLNNYNLEHVK